MNFEIYLNINFLNIYYQNFEILKIYYYSIIIFSNPLRYLIIMRHIIQIFLNNKYGNI